MKNGNLSSFWMFKNPYLSLYDALQNGIPPIVNYFTVFAKYNNTVVPCGTTSSATEILEGSLPASDECSLEPRTARLEHKTGTVPG